MQKQQGKNNATSLFGVHEIPCDNQIRNLLDPVPPETLFPLIVSIGDELYRNGFFDKFYSINNTLLIAMDGTDFFSSEKISCPSCSQSKQKNGKTLSRHIAVTPVLVAPGQKNVIPLAPAFVQPQDGHDKQDCELAASGRWLDQWGAYYAPLGITYLGDDLYSHQPHCVRVLEHHSNFLFTCKPASHTHLSGWVEALEPGRALHTLTLRVKGKGNRWEHHEYRWANGVPLTDGAIVVETESAGRPSRPLAPRESTC